MLSDADYERAKMRGPVTHRDHPPLDAVFRTLAWFRTLALGGGVHRGLLTTVQIVQAAELGAQQSCSSQSIMELIVSIALSIGGLLALCHAY